MNRIFLIFVIVVLSVTSLKGQATGTKYVLTFKEVVELAKQQSPQAIEARHSFRASYFRFMNYKANFLPKLTLATNPAAWKQSIQTVPVIDDDKVNYKEAKANTLTSTVGLELRQNIGFTGGNISLGSDFSRIQNFLQDNSDFATQFTTTPIELRLEQPLNGYNRFRWLKKIEPLEYEAAKQNYIVQMEYVAGRAIDNFFLLAISQVNLNMLQTNLKNTEELYNVMKGRYNLGTVTEDDMLRVELRHMEASSDLNSALIGIESAQNRLRSFLGFRDNVEIELLIDHEIPSFKVSPEKALDLALTRNPDIISQNLKILAAEEDVAYYRSQKGITLTMNASFGLDNTGYTFDDGYSSPFNNRQNISAGIRVPILDWSQAKNRYRQAQSSLEVVEAQMQQQETDFKQNVFLQVMGFNMQEEQLRIAAKSDTIASKSYNIMYQRYLTGKGTVTDLNLADTAKDNAKIGYMRALNTYWNLFYTVRRLTLFDFLNNQPLEEDFNLIVGE